MIYTKITKPLRQEEIKMKSSELYKAFRKAQKTAYRKQFFDEYDEAISPSEWATDVINGGGGQVSWGSVKAGFHGFRDCISVRNHTGKKVVIKKPTRPLKTPIDNFDNDVEIIEIEEVPFEELL